MCTVNIVNRISCFCLIIFFLRGDWGWLCSPWPPPGYVPVRQRLWKSVIASLYRRQFHDRRRYFRSPSFLVAGSMVVALTRRHISANRQMCFVTSHTDVIAAEAMTSRRLSPVQSERRAVRGLRPPRKTSQCSPGDVRP